jgi:hypothetical protein
MRIAVICILTAAALAACSPKGEGAADKPTAGGASNPLAAVTGPPRPKAGVWESTMTMASPAPMTVSSQVCIDEAMLKDDQWMKPQGQPGGMECEQQMLNVSGGYGFKSTCKMGERTTTAEGRATGDFNSAYRMDITSRTDPVPQGMPAESKMTVEARYMGPCAPGQAGGPVPGSVKMSPAG